MFKTIDPMGWDWHGEPSFAQVKISSRGLRGNDLKALRKRASDDLMRKIAESELFPDELMVHGLAVGDYETTGANRKGDAFDSHTCRTRHHTFKKYAKWYRNHEDSDPLNSFGRIAASDYNEPMGRIELLCGLNTNKTAADRNEGKIATIEMNKLASGDNLPISMGCRVAYDVCTCCGNKAKTADDYCDESSCPAGGCKNYLGKLRKVGSDLKHIGVFNPGCYFVDISLVHRPAGRTCYAYLADSMKKAASDTDGQRIVGSAETARQLGLLGPTWLVTGDNPESILRRKMAAAVDRVRNTTIGGVMVSQWDCELADLTKHVTASDAPAQLAALAEAGILVGLQDFAAINNASTYAASARGLVGQFYKRAMETADYYSVKEDRWASATPCESWKMTDLIAKTASELGLETGFKTRAIRSSVSASKPSLPVGPDSPGGRKLAADYVDYRLSALSRYLPNAVDDMLTLKCAIMQDR